MWHYGIRIHSPLTSVGVVHSTWPSHATWHMHAPTFNKWQKKNKNKNEKVTLHLILTHGAMRGCGLTSLVICINDKIHDIRERNTRIKSEIWTTNIRSPSVRDIREWVVLWGLILRSLGCSPSTSLDFPLRPWPEICRPHCCYNPHQPSDVLGQLVVDSALLALMHRTVFSEPR